MAAADPLPIPVLPRTHKFLATGLVLPSNQLKCEKEHANDDIIILANAAVCWGMENRSLLQYSGNIQIYFLTLLRHNNSFGILLLLYFKFLGFLSSHYALTAYSGNMNSQP